MPFLPAEGSIPHFAILVKNLDEAAAAIRSAGVDTFRGSEKSVNTRLFGRLENWFFTGPSWRAYRIAADVRMISDRFFNLCCKLQQNEL